MVSHNFYYTIYLFLAKYCAAWGTHTQKILSHSKTSKKHFLKEINAESAKKRRVKVSLKNQLFEFDHSKDMVHFISSFYIIHLSRVDIYNSKWKIAYIKDFLYIN